MLAVCPTGLAACATCRAPAPPACRLSQYLEQGLSRPRLSTTSSCAANPSAVARAQRRRLRASVVACAEAQPEPDPPAGRPAVLYDLSDRQVRAWLLPPLCCVWQPAEAAHRRRTCAPGTGSVRSSLAGLQGWSVVNRPATSCSSCSTSRCTRWARGAAWTTCASTRPPRPGRSTARRGVERPPTTARGSWSCTRYST
jgi:hypothetical protein